MARSRKRAAKPRRTGRRASAVTHAVAGFTLSVLAIGAGLLFAGTGREQPPLSAAAEQSATVAAVQIALSGNDDQTPIAVAPERPDADPQPFLTSEQPVINVRGATRVVVESVGIDSEVRTVGFTFRNGRLQYDVPRSQAGQYAGTASPGDSGNTVIGGHVANRGGIAVFEPLPGVKAGDLIEVYSGDKVFRYSVTEIKVVAADATTVMRPTQDATLTLITCFPEDGYRERLVVVGKLL